MTGSTLRTIAWMAGTSAFAVVAATAPAAAGAQTSVEAKPGVQAQPGLQPQPAEPAPAVKTVTKSAGTRAPRS